MELLVILTFVMGYLAITLEQSLKIDKLIPAITMMAIMWTLVSFGGLNLFDIVQGEGLVKIAEKHGESPVSQVLLHHLGKTAEILIFLIGAMTIVEIIDQFKGFYALKTYIKTKNKVKLLWVVGFMGFFLSSVIDNLTATIVLITILRKLVESPKLKMWYASLIVIATNAGGSWSPIGDVTTTMLWIAHKVEVVTLIKSLFVPAFACFAIPFGIASLLPAFKGYLDWPTQEEEKQNPHGLSMLILGISMIIFVPIFKTLTHLPPYIGMMISLAVVAIVAEGLSRRSFDLSSVETQENVVHNPLHHSLSRIEMPSILFFFGITLVSTSWYLDLVLHLLLYVWLVLYFYLSLATSFLKEFSL
ncbi:MAG: sodium:proton antiporter [Flavobacteriaceae bacterium]|nr:MAG: sodium:proton antiporter [Flavobacteriaceae bacterium]